jgi:hypothetical protein
MPVTSNLLPVTTYQWRAPSPSLMGLLSRSLVGYSTVVIDLIILYIMDGRFLALTCTHVKVILFTWTIHSHKQYLTFLWLLDFDQTVKQTSKYCPITVNAVMYTWFFYSYIPNSIYTVPPLPYIFSVIFLQNFFLQIFSLRSNFSMIIAQYWWLNNDV